jgi:hypothetical protein
LKILLDECVPWPLAKHLTGHEFKSVQFCGWAGVKNGELLRLAEGQFDLFLTADQSLRYQQNLTGRKIAILRLSTNDLRRILAAVNLIQTNLASMQLAEFRRIDIP